VNPRTSFSWLPVTTMADGSELRLPLHVLQGAKPGPTLGLTGLIHGDEALPSVAIIRRIFELLDSNELAGTVMAVPVVNPLGAGLLARNTPLDGFNMNTAFGVPPEDSTVMPVRSISEEIARVLTDGFLSKLNFHIDYHAGDDGLAVNMIEYADDPESLAVARSFGMPILLKDSWGANQMWGASARCGARVIVAECGGGALLFDEWLQRGVRGAFNVMRHLGMLPGEVQKPTRQYVVDNTKGHHRNLVLGRCREGGLFMPDPAITPRVSFDGQPVGGKLVLGQLISMYDLAVSETFASPFERTLLLASAVAPSWRAVGDTLYIVADADVAEVLE